MTMLELYGSTAFDLTFTGRRSSIQQAREIFETKFPCYNPSMQIQ